ncbi:MAG: transcription termination/antitermination protein NusA [Victivallales bacterium]|nr:transcription termination/antitermination protein NusA [Victivallales bacterium]
MNNELSSRLEELELTRGIDRESLVKLLEDSLLNAAKKAVAQSREMRVQVDPKTLRITCISKLIVAEKVTDPTSEISLRDARAKYPDVVAGQEVEWEVTPVNFGRIAAQHARNTIIQGIRQAEKRNISEQFKEQLNQLITGEVRRVDRDGVLINFGQADGLLRREDRIPREDFETGDVVTALLTEINNGDKPGPALLVSRASPDFVRRLFEREVTEISDGLVEIKGIAREAGSRSKIAVASKDSRIDPSGACIGLRGTRVRTIVRELSGEKVDIIEWSDNIATYVSNALKPAKLQSISVDEASHTVKVLVSEDQLSLAIGKKGQNARLATWLTGWKVDIEKTATPETPEESFAAQKRRAIEVLSAVEGIGNEAAETLVHHGFVSLEGIAAPDVEINDLATLPGFDESKALAVIAAAKAALGQ